MVRFLLVLTVLFVVLCSSALAAAGSQSPGSVIPVSEFASATGDFVVALDRDVAGLDAAVVEDTASLLVAAQIYDTLVVYRPSDSFPMPGLAQSWSVSADGLTWTFNLRPGVSFHDGTALNADAVAFNIRRWWDAANPYHTGDFVYFEALFGGFRGDPGCLITDVHAIGSTQVQLVLRQRDSVLPSLLASGAFGIASPAAIQADTLGVHPVGSGPFSFVERVPADRIRLAANAAYWGGTPHLAGLVFQVISDTTARFAALKSGTVHSAEGYAPGAATDPDLHPMSRPSLNIGYLGINQGHTPLNSPLVQAGDRPRDQPPRARRRALRERRAGRTSSSCRRASGVTTQACPITATIRYWRSHFFPRPATPMASRPRSSIATWCAATCRTHRPRPLPSMLILRRLVLTQRSSRWSPALF